MSWRMKLFKWQKHISLNKRDYLPSRFVEELMYGYGGVSLQVEDITSSPNQLEEPYCSQNT